MHFNFDFSAAQILWTFMFAALLVLLVVLLGRDRARRFPLFTTAMVMMAPRLLASRLLFGRMAPIVSSEIFLTLADVASIVALLVVVEMARRAFAGASRGAWIAATLVLLAVAGTVLAAWGPWPSAKTLFAASTIATLRLMQLAAEKIDMLADLLTVQLGLLVFLFGRRFKAGWRSHTQQIVIGLSTVSMAQLAVRASWQAIALHTTIHQRADYERVMALQGKFYNANSAVILAALLWWIVCLWFDEPGAPSAAGAAADAPPPAEGGASQTESSNANAEASGGDQP